MHILLLSGGKVFKSAYGGEDLFTRSLGRWLANNRHEATLLGVEFAGTRARYLSYDAVKSIVAPVTDKKKKSRKFGLAYLLYSLRTVIWMFQLLKILLINAKYPIDIIHAQDSGYTGLAAIAASKILKIPIIVTLHGIRYDQIKSNPYVNKILKKITLKIEHRLDVLTLRNANIITLVNSTLKDYVEPIAPKNMIVTIPVAINKENFEFSTTKRDETRKELGLDNKSNVLGFVGRLSYEKNLFTLFDSFAAAVKSDSSLKLVLVGEGPLEFELKNRAGELGINDKVIFCGFRNDIGNILSSIDIFVLPSFIEGTSNALLQAMMGSRAILCSNIPGNREIVTNDYEALMINPKDRDGFTNAILQLFSDEKLKNRLGRNARNTAAQYEEDVIFPKFIRFYQDLKKGK